jgi:two-component system NtrC family sensor kinase
MWYVPEKEPRLQLQAERASIRLLVLMMAGTIILPILLFAYATWVDYGNAYATARERIDRSLDVLQEHAQRVFEPIDLIFLEVEHLLDGLLEESIRVRESKLSLQLKAIADALAQVESVWVYDADGRPLIASNTYPVRTDKSDRDEDYFAAHVGPNIGLFVGGTLQAAGPIRSEASPVFAVSRRWLWPDGDFAGVVRVTVIASELERFYASVGRYPGAYYSMVRADGTFLARYPKSPNLQRLGTGTGFQKQLAEDPAGGIYVAGSIIDGRERMIGTRKLAQYPIYISTGIETAAIRNEWLAAVAARLAFGVPATAALLAALGVALIRTRRALAEATRREQVEDALRQTQRLEAVGKLTGGVAHDFNNLLMVVMASAERLLRDERPPREKRYLEMIKTAAERGQSLTRQLLTFARRQALNPEVVDLAARMPAMREMLERSLRGDIAVTMDVVSETCRVAVDIGELDLAILNLGVNARDAMPQGGTLTLRVHRVTLHGSPDDLDGEFVALSVSDTGIGIVPELLQRVFEPFFTTKEVGKGTGLGLSQVYGFARQSGGTAIVDSVPGLGTTVTLFLPVSAAESAPQAVATKGIRPRDFALHVLIVEDERDVAELAGDLLAELGCSSAVTESIDGAMTALTRERFDVVLSDILMPGGKTGLDLAHHLRSAHPDIGVVLATGYSASAEEALREGLIVLRKPYSRDDLAAALARVLASSEAVSTPSE